MRTLGAVIKNPLYLIVLAVAIFEGLTIAWWMLPLGVAVVAVAVVVASRDQGFVAQVQQQATRASITNALLRVTVERIEATQRQIEQGAQRAQGPLVKVLTRISSQTRTIADQAYDLAVKGQTLDQYTTTNDPAKLRTQIRQIEAQIAQTTDQYTRQQLDQTLAAVVDQEENAEALRTYRQRIDAQLSNIAANLENVLSETVRLRTADAVTADSTGNQVADRLSDLNADMNAFQQMLDTALSHT